ncbi:high light inducible protein [Clostridiales bacterium PH28_bin88]|nr:high light inducible protein [Clostridiales bacterium PH28_bin88]
MLLSERNLVIPLVRNHSNLLQYLSGIVLKKLKSGEIPVRFVITKTDRQGYHCELGILSNMNNVVSPPKNSIFDYNVRSHQNTTQFNAVLLIPTGIGAEIGGHSGDGGAVARLLAASCDNLITHPNVVNASDINELPENALYVEGSVITRLLMGTVSIQKVHSNRVMLVIDEHEDGYFDEAAVNSASAARVALGLDCPLVVKMSKKVLVEAFYASSGRAVGRIQYLERLCEVLEKYRSQYDAVALATVIEVPPHLYEDYFEGKNNIVNPWGGVEAMLTHGISMLYDIPSAHSPMSTSEEFDLDLGVVDPRKSAESISITNLHCILKGLHKSPRIINSLMYDHIGILTVADISCLVIPDGCVGLPTLAALEQGIPVIAVRENKNLMQNKLEELPFAPGKLFIADNYLEAVGLMNALKAGVASESVRRPLAYTTVHEY